MDDDQDVVTENGVDPDGTPHDHGTVENEEADDGPLG